MDFADLLLKTRTIALPLPVGRLTDDRRVETIRPILAETIAALIDHITRLRPWSIRDRAYDSVRAARPGDVGLLVRKMTPEFIGPFEHEFARRGIPYRLVGGKEYYAREEVQALTAVLRAIDNPADRLAVFAALRSPFFSLSDDDVFQFVSGGGILNPLAPIPDGASNADLVGRAFAILQSLHRRRRMQPPSEVIAVLLRENPRPTRLPAAHRRRPERRQPMEGARGRARLRGGRPRNAARGRSLPPGRGPAREDFAFETTLASRSLLRWVERLRASGYHVHLAFLSLTGPELAVARVAERVRQGGHDVPEEVVRRRYFAGLRNFFTLFESSVDSWQMFDNSLPTGPRLIAARPAGEERRVLDVEAWDTLVEQSR